MNKAVLITGASGGLGLEFAKLFAKDGRDLVLVARNEGKLYALKNELETKYRIRVYVYAKDLSKEDAAYDVYDYVLEKEIFIDILINNAGFGDFGIFVHSDLKKQTDMVHVNILTLMQMCHLFAGPMEEHGKGTILNMCSTAGFQPGALMSVYYATKAFVLSFTEAISVELKETNISVVAFCPGPTQTGFVEGANLETSGLFKKLKTASSRKVAEYGYQEMKKKKVVVVHGFQNKVLIFLCRLFPRKVIRNVVYRIQKQQ